MVDVDDPPGEPVADVRVDGLHMAGKNAEIDKELLDEGEQLFVAMDSGLG